MIQVLTFSSPTLECHCFTTFDSGSRFSLTIPIGWVITLIGGGGYNPVTHVITPFTAGRGPPYARNAR